MDNRYRHARNAAAFLAFAAALCAQVQTAKPRFEVASVKLCKENLWGTNGGGASPGRLTIHCTAVVNLVRQAYAVFAGGKMNRAGQETKVEGGPAWAYSELYEIQAKAEGNPGPGVMPGPMMQSLLEDRFHLKIHRETREVPVYVLTVAKGGVRLPAAKQPCFTVGPGHPQPDLPLEQLIRLRCGAPISRTVNSTCTARPSRTLPTRCAAPALIAISSIAPACPANLTWTSVGRS